MRIGPIISNNEFCAVVCLFFKLFNDIFLVLLYSLTFFVSVFNFSLYCSGLKTFFYMLTFQTIKKNKYLFRFLGILTSLIGMKSFYRIEKFN